MPATCNADFQYICQLVYDHSSICLGQEKRQMVDARLHKRLRKLELSSVSEYCDYLRSNRDPEELTHLIDTLSTNFTQFFREIAHFHFLKERIIPDFFAQIPHARKLPFRAWSAACSSGEEPYSLAIALAECFQGANPQEWQILATDISTRVLEKAASGIYEASRVTLPDTQWLSRYFQKGRDKWEGHYRVKKQLQQQINFQHMNLLQPTIIADGLFDVIFCRNVMIYFNQETIQALVENLHRHLYSGGYLIIGSSENLNKRPKGLIQIKSCIYRKS